MLCYIGFVNFQNFVSPADPYFAEQYEDSSDSASSDIEDTFGQQLSITESPPSSPILEFIRPSPATSTMSSLEQPLSSPVPKWDGLSRVLPALNTNILGLPTVAYKGSSQTYSPIKTPSPPETQDPAAIDLDYLVDVSRTPPSSPKKIAEKTIPGLLSGSCH